MPPLAPIKPLAPLDKGGGGGGDGEWSCETCLVPNKNSDNKCVCCGGSKPGEKVRTVVLTTHPLRVCVCVVLFW